MRNGNASRFGRVAELFVRSLLSDLDPPIGFQSFDDVAAVHDHTYTHATFTPQVKVCVFIHTGTAMSDLAVLGMPFKAGRAEASERRLDTVAEKSGHPEKATDAFSRGFRRAGTATGQMDDEFIKAGRSHDEALRHAKKLGGALGNLAGDAVTGVVLRPDSDQSSMIDRQGGGTMGSSTRMGV